MKRLGREVWILAVVLIVFVAVGITMVRSFHPETGTPTLRPA